MARFRASIVTALPFKFVAICRPETSVISTDLRFAVSRENSVWDVVGN